MARAALLEQWADQEDGSAGDCTSQAPIESAVLLPCLLLQALALPAPPEQARAERPAPLPVLPRAPEAVAAEEEAKKKAEEAAARQR